ncbi:DNA-3-methyladenine glycosylase I [Bradyrhizobium sp. LB1.3]
MKSAFLPDRGVVKVAGEDARNFLNGLVTTDVDKLKPGLGRFGALLTPQGKITVDFLITEAPAGHGGGFLIDCPKPLADSLATKLKFYKLRAKVTVENLSDDLGVLAAWDGKPAAQPDLAFADPRNGELGYRILIPEDLKQKLSDLIGAELVDAAAYEARRIALGVPRGGLDFMYSDAFPHETNMDRLSGVDFDKGCYVGQEVVSRMQHRGTARTRSVKVLLEDLSPELGVSVLAGDKPVGTMGSSAQGKGIALVRIDRVADALDAGQALTAGGLAVRLAEPDVCPHSSQAAHRMSRAPRLHPDGITRCPWPGEDPVYVAYHDTEWGVPEYDDRALYEKLILDGFQAGLSWITILRKRDNFRKAFDDFQPEKIARYNEKKVHALMNDAGIVRNKAKIDGAIASAKSYLDIMEKGPGFSKLLWDFMDGSPKVNHFKTTASVPASTPLSMQISKELSSRGFKFVGPTIVYAFMEATGLVNDHLVDCHCHASCGKTQRKPRLKSK